VDVSQACEQFAGEIAELSRRFLEGDDYPAKPVFGPRSPGWPKKEKEYKAVHPKCIACGTTKFCVVHHKLPFHVRPDLELKDENLRTMCETPSHNCHLIFGHLLSWVHWNLHVDEDAALYLDHLLKRAG
jgi:5-methylcytosine-specific restriction enzyme A